MAEQTSGLPPSTFITINTTINGQPWQGQVRAEETLLEFLRERLRLTGTKRSCESQVCGVCTVLVNQQPISSCNYLVREADAKSLLTVEGLASNDRLDPIQEAFMRHEGFQCGFCTPGMIMASKALLLETVQPTREEIVKYLHGNICRCGAYPSIIAAILEVAAQRA